MLPVQATQREHYTTCAMKGPVEQILPIRMRRGQRSSGNEFFVYPELGGIYSKAYIYSRCWTSPTSSFVRIDRVFLCVSRLF